MTQLFKYFLKLGLVGFGGPVALVSRMQEDLVKTTKQVSEENFQKSLTLSALSPGPLAAQLAMNLGWYESGPLGAFLAGFFFVLPGFVIVLAFSYLYVRYESFTWLHALFFGASSGVIPIIFQSGVKLAKNSLKKDFYLWTCALVAFSFSFWAWFDLIWVLLGIGIVSVLKGISFRNRTAVLMPQLFWFFFKGGAFVYGSGFSIIPYLRPGLVEQLRWVTEQQFVDAIAVAMLTPGPVLITVAFLGFLIAGFSGAVVASAGVFLPSFCFTVFGAPWFDRFSNSERLKNFVSGVTAGAIGGIFGAVASISIHTLDEPRKWAIAGIASALILIKKYRLPDPAVLLICALVGLLLAK